MQLVLSGKNIVAYGEGFLAMGGTVINPDTGAVHQNATIVECENCPADLGKVGYEYHAGEFVPCGPFGEGDGNIAVWCDDCKTPRDSGLKVSEMGKMFHTTYTGSGTSSCSVTCGFRPKHIIITGYYGSGNNHYMCIMSAGNAESGTGYGITFQSATTPGSGVQPNIGSVKCTANETGATWQYFGGDNRYSAEVAMNSSRTSYFITVLG